jgi:hypothetical protein
MRAVYFKLSSEPNIDRLSKHLPVFFSFFQKQPYIFCVNEKYIVAMRNITYYPDCSKLL